MHGPRYLDMNGTGMSRLRVWLGLLAIFFLFGGLPGRGQDRPELVLQNGHAASVCHADFSPDGQTLVSVGKDNTVKVWEVGTGKLLRTKENHSFRGRCVVFSPDGKTFASGSPQKKVKIWDLSTGNLLQSLRGHTDDIKAVTFSPNGKLIASASGDKTVRVWEVLTGGHFKTLQGHSLSVAYVTFSPDGQTLASGSLDNTVKVWDVATGRLLRTLEGHSSSVYTVAYSSDGSFLVSAGADSTVKIWEAASGNLLRTLNGHTSAVRSAVFSPNGEAIASGGHDDTVKVWEVGSGRLLHTLNGHASSVVSVAFSPSGEKVVSGSWDNTAKVWEVVSGELLQTLERHSAHLASVAFSPKDAILASGSRDNTIRIWGTSTGMLLESLEGHTSVVESVAFSPEGKFLASGSKDDTIKIWEMPTGRLLSTLEGHKSDVHSVVFSPNGKSLASGSLYGNVKIWELKTGRLLRTLGGHEESTNAVAFSPDSEVLASGHGNGIVHVWEVSTGRHLRSLRGHADAVFSVAISPDGQHLASGSWDDTVKVWDLETGKLLRTLEGHISAVWSIAFSPNSESLASGSLDNTIKIWDVATGNLHRTLAGHTSVVSAVAISSDGILASGSWDTSLRFWRLADGEQLATSYSSGNDYITFTPEGLYAASEGGETLAAWRVDGEVYGFEQYAEQFRQPELVAQRLAGRHVEVPGGVQLAVDRPPTLRWIQRFTETASSEVLVVLSYEGTSALEDLVLFFNGEPLNVDAEGRNRIEISLPVASRENVLNALAFDAKRLRSDPVRVTFDYVGGPEAEAVEIAFGGELPPEVLEASEIQINQERLQVVDVDPEKKTFKLLGDPGILKRGTNWIASLDDRWRFWWQDGKLHRMPNPYERSYAILVAIDDYDRLKDPKLHPTGLDPLGKMVPGAQKLKAALMRLGFPGGHITTLYDQDATSDRIHQELERFWKGGDRSGAHRLVLYFGGHGQGTDGRGSLVTYDYDPASPARTSFLMGDFVSRHFAHVDVHHLLVALDACSSGLAIPGLNTLDNVDEERLKQFRQLSVVLGDTEERARNLLLAGTEDERALYDEGGVFTRALIDGLQGQADWNQDGVIQFGELSLHIKNQVTAIARTAGVKQRPSYYRGTDFGSGEVLFFTP